VPYIRGNQTQTGVKNISFNRTFALARGFAANDIGKSAKLISDIGSNLATKIKSPLGGGASAITSKRFRIIANNTKYAQTVRSNTTFDVDYAQLSAKIKSIQKNGGKIASVTEIA
jgi:phycoerythrin-associated linker protein